MSFLLASCFSLKIPPQVIFGSFGEAQDGLLGGGWTGLTILGNGCQLITSEAIVCAGPGIRKQRVPSVRLFFRGEQYIGLKRTFSRRAISWTEEDLYQGLRVSSTKV